MKAARIAFVRIALIAFACSVPLAASAQWQWLDKSGRKVFSDQAPPPDITPDRVLRKPGSRARGFEDAPAAPVAAAAPADAASLPKPSGRDKALEDKKKQLQSAEEEKRKAEEQKNAQLRAENCSRAKSGKANFDSGARIARVNAKGEREIMDDAARAAEVKLLNEVIARDCPQ